MSQVPDDLAGRLEALSPDERARLERALLARRRRHEQPLRPREPTAPAVLSSAQRRLWFFDHLAPGSPTYNAIVAMWLEGPVDLDVLERAVAATVARHEVLHSVIEVPAGSDEPLQRVLTDWELRLGRHVAEGDTREARREAALDLARSLARAPYDLARDLTLRADVVEVGPDEHLLVVSEHHIAFDGWSDEIAFREISDHYAAVVAGGPEPVLPPLPVQYADYAVWQRARIDAGDLAGHADYWRTALAGAPAVAALPLDRPRPVPQRFDGQHLDVSLPHADAVRRFRIEHGCTDFMVLVAAWAATLYRWSGESDLVLGTPMANRNRVEVESLVGFFSNTVPLRVRVDGAAGFGALVDRVRETALAAFDHQDLPFQMIVEAADAERVPGANPLFCVNVRVQSGPPPVVELPGVEVTPVHVDIGFARFDLAIELQMQESQIGGYLEYNEAVLDRSTGEDLLVRLDQLLGAGLADPDEPLWSLPQPSTAGTRRSRRRTAVPAATAGRRTVAARLPHTRVEPGEVHLHWLDLSRPVELDALSPEELARAAAYRFERDRDRFVRRRALLRRILGDALGLRPADVAYRVNAHDRPAVADDDVDLHFSASSSGETGLVALARHEIGADVEELVASDTDRDVAHRLFSAEEVSALDRADPDDFVRLFFNCWTRKEAYVKATGLGLSFPLTAFAVEVHDTATPGLLRADLWPDDPSCCSIRSLDVPGGGAAAAIVVEHHDPVLISHNQR